MGASAPTRSNPQLKRLPLERVVQRFLSAQSIEHQENVRVLACQASAQHTQSKEKSDGGYFRAAVVGSDGDSEEKGQAYQLSVDTEDKQWLVE
jgi:hypothetical protein